MKFYNEIYTNQKTGRKGCLVEVDMGDEGGMQIRYEENLPIIYTYYTKTRNGEIEYKGFQQKWSSGEIIEKYFWQLSKRSDNPAIRARIRSMEIEGAEEEIAKFREYVKENGLPSDKSS